MPDPPLHPPSSDPTTDLPTLCSTCDRGGGVALASSSRTSNLVIYTTTTLPHSLQLLCLAPPSSLASLASTVAERIPIHLTISSLGGEPISLPSSPDGCREIDSLPWFFINAARFSGHTIAGRGSIVETLLAVLRRPWCILELCCTPLSIVQSLLAFAKCAYGFDDAGYGAAVALLCHELTTREVTDPISSLFRGIVNPIRLSASVQTLRTVCLAVFDTSLRSHNGFWLRLVCASALQLGIPYSRLGLLLNGGGSGNLPVNGVWGWRWRGFDFPSHRSGHVKAVGEWDRAPYHRLRKARSDVALVRGGWGGKADVELIPFAGMVPKEVLLWVYARVLEQIGNEV